MADTQAKEKIAILGGGWGAVSTALFLTDPRNPNRDRYDITFYQLGWRLGGKGASGRGASGRIEEHGLHIWMGFYNNSFRAIQQVYEEVQPIYQRITHYAQNPFKSWQDAFRPHNYILFAENVEAQWKLWGIDCPTNAEVPGKGDNVILRPEDYIRMLLEFMRRVFTGSALAQSSKTPEEDGLLSKIGSVLSAIDLGLHSVELSVGEAILVAGLDLAKLLSAGDPRHPEALLTVMGHFRDWLRTRMQSAIQAELAEVDILRRLFITLDMAGTIVIGLLEDGVLTHEEGLDALDVSDFREWLSKHGAAPEAVFSGPVQGLYDLVFGYENGEIGRPNFAAGVAIRSLVCIGLCYKGSIMWKMQAGMGDTVFAPPYLVLKERGVKFKFFHRVKGLRLSSDRQRVEKIELAIQAQLVPGRTEYDPLVIVKDLPSWPSKPDYAQLVEGAALRDGDIDLESFYTDWQDPASATLELSQDFDRVVLGISIASLPFVCPELIQANPAFAAMVEQVKTVRTQAFQLWLKPDLKGLGWEQATPVLDAYVEPMNTWADMSQVLDKETWPDGAVGNISYFCGPMVGDTPPPADHSVPSLARERVRENALSFVQAFTGFLWPKAAPPGNPNGLDFSLLADDQGGQGMARFDHQYFRANVDPSERYVLSLKGTTTYRLKPNESGFENLVLTGDWTRNGFNAGCVEATTMSGMLAAQAISGFPTAAEITTY
jgi:uncharacterized protein with NAD-binding domain and iron-sulfur cluster